MNHFSKGDLVVLPFPFSDLSASKRRPALVVALLTGDYVICCQITSEARFDEYAIILKTDDLLVGKLQTGMIRPNKLFTADRSIILYKIDSLKEKKVKDIENFLVKIFTS